MFNMLVGDEKIVYNDSYMYCSQLDEDNEVSIEIENNIYDYENAKMVLDINCMLILKKWLDKEIERYNERTK